MMDIISAIGVALVGLAIATFGYLNFRGAWKRVRGSRAWARTSARVTKAWTENVSGEPGNTRYHVNYTFTAAETGGSYYGHSDGGAPDVETGGNIEVMYDPKAPHNNELPLRRFEMWFYPIFFGILAAFGAALSLFGLVGTAVLITS